MLTKTNRSRNTRKINWEEIQELINLAQNLTHTNDSELQSLLGLSSDTNFNTWRKVGQAPAWIVPALKGVISEHQEITDLPKLQVGMRLTNEHLEYLNLATAEFILNHPNDPKVKSMKKMRSVLLLELAGRLDCDK